MNKPNEKRIINDIRLGKKNEIQAIEQLQHLLLQKNIVDLNLTSHRNPKEYVTIIGRQENALNNSPAQKNVLLTTHLYQKDGEHRDHVEDTLKTEKIEPTLVIHELDHTAHIAVKARNALTNPERQFLKRSDTHPKTVKDDVSHATKHLNHQEDLRYDEQELHRTALKIDHHAENT